MNSRSQRRPKASDRPWPGLALAITAFMLTLAISTPAEAVPFNVNAGRGGSALPLATAPSVQKIQPKGGPGGTHVTIFGSNLTGATAVQFGSTPATFSVKSPTEIRALAPSGTGTQDVTVTTPEGTSTVNPADRFTYVLAGPAVLELLPNHGRVRGGQRIRIPGVNFTGATEVHFGSAGASFTVNSARSIQAISPEGTGTVDVTVTTPEGTSPVSPADRFTYTGKPPTIRQISPPKGPAAGGTTVGISGNNFFGATAVHFGGTNATTFTVDSANAITAVSPAESVGRVDVVVTTPYGANLPEECIQHPFEEEPQCFSSDHFNFIKPTVTNVTPNLGSVAGGTSVTLTGTGFALGEGAIRVMFGTTLATSVDCSSISTCTAVAPAHTAKTVFVTVRVKQLTSEKSPANEYKYG